MWITHDRIPRAVAHDPAPVPVHVLQDGGVVWARGADSNDVLLGERGIVEKHAHDVGVRVSNHARDQLAVVRAREGFSFAERERPTAPEVRHAPRGVVRLVAVCDGHHEIGDVVKLELARSVRERATPRLDARFEERPPKREKHRLRRRLAARRAVVRVVEQAQCLLVVAALDPLADQPDAHRELFDTREAREQLCKRRRWLHGEGPSLSLPGRARSASLTHCVAGLASKPMAEAEQVRVIKRYANRKLYDTCDSKYITLDRIAELVRNGEEVKVLDNRSKQDLTKVTLAQIIYEEQKSGNATAWSVQSLRRFIQQGRAKILTSLKEGPVAKLVGMAEELRAEVYSVADDKVRAVLERAAAHVKHLQGEVLRLQARIEELEAKVRQSSQKDDPPDNVE